MNILVTGANGFLARAIIHRLHRAGHHITACLRKPSNLFSALARVNIIVMDFTQIQQPEQWYSALTSIDVIINCAGVFQANKKTMWQIHHEGPQLLFAAAQTRKVKHIVQISALGIDVFNAPYAASKRATDEHLQQSSLDVTILRPSFIYGPGSYGGSSLFRGLAGLPFLLPIPGDGHFKLQPIHIDDVARIVEESLSFQGKNTIAIAGSEQISIAQLLQELRQWLGFKKNKLFSIPWRMMKFFARIGDKLGNTPISSTALGFLQQDNVLSEQQEQQLNGFFSWPRISFRESLFKMVSQVQDRWHARLYFLRPLLRLSLSFLWIYSGIIAFVTANPHGYHLLQQVGLNATWQPLAVVVTGGLDLLLGLSCLSKRYLKLSLIGQLIAVTTYTLIISLFIPHYWLDPFGSISKNITIAIAIGVMLAIEDQR